MDEKRWIGERRFLHALNYCMLLPGPEAHQLAIYLGWLMHGVRGGLWAGTLFVAPGYLAIMALSAVYVAFGRTELIAGFFFGLKAAVLAIVLQAVIRVGRRSLTSGPLRAVAAVSFLAILLLQVPFPALVLGAGVFGWLAAKAGWAAFETALVGGAGAGDDRSVLGAQAVHRRGTGPVILVLTTLWLVPIVPLLLVPGPGPAGDILRQDGGGQLWRRLCRCAITPCWVGRWRRSAPRLSA